MVWERGKNAMIKVQADALDETSKQPGHMTVLERHARRVVEAAPEARVVKADALCSVSSAWDTLIVPALHGHSRREPSTLDRHRDCLQAMRTSCGSRRGTRSRSGRSDASSSKQAAETSF